MKFDRFKKKAGPSVAPIGDHMAPMIFNAQVYDIRVKRNGGRLQLDFGVDAIPVIQEIMATTALRDMNFQIAIVQVDPEELNQEN